MAVLSINLGLINLFPIPVLDGGHLVLYLLEFIRGRPLSGRKRKKQYRLPVGDSNCINDLCYLKRYMARILV